MSPNHLDALLIRIRFNPFFEQSRVYDQSLGLLSIATYCKQHDFAVRVLNDPHITLDLLDNILKTDNIGVLGFFVDADNVFTTLSAIDALKARHPNLMCVAGGPQVSAVPWDEKIVTESRCDVAVRGDGERVFVDILRGLRYGTPRLAELRGISYVSDGTFRRAPDGDVFDLEHAPIPDRTLTYFPSIPTGVETIYTSKGCPYHCAFCFEGIRGRGYRTRSVGEVINEVNDLLVSRNMRYMLIMDDTFVVDVSRVLEITAELARLQEVHHKFHWYCEGRANIIRRNPQIIKPMIDAGLLRLQIGIESGTDAVLDSYEKGLSLEDIRETVRFCYEAGLTSIVGNFILGGPFETWESINASIAFAKELLELAPGCMDVTASIYGPYPATKMYLQPESYGIEVVDRECVTGAAMDYVFTRTKDLSKWDILKAKEMFYEEVEAKAVSLMPIVSTERILRHFDGLFELGLNTMWAKVFSKYRNYRNYFGSIVSESKKPLGDVAGNVDSYKPLRTMPIREALSDGVVITMDDRRRLELSDLSSRIYEFCSGKITTDQIVDNLFRETGQQVDRSVLREYVLKTFEMLDNEKLVVFSAI